MIFLYMALIAVALDALTFLLVGVAARRLVRGLTGTLLAGLARPTASSKPSTAPPDPATRLGL